VFWDKAKAGVQTPDETVKEKIMALRIHDLRYAYAVKLAEEETSMHFISEVMGHHSIEFTRKWYRFSPSAAFKAVLRVLQGRKVAQAERAANGQ
jgi:hypothetical protein